MTDDNDAAQPRQSISAHTAQTIRRLQEDALTKAVQALLISYMEIRARNVAEEVDLLGRSYGEAWVWAPSEMPIVVEIEDGQATLKMNEAGRFQEVWEKEGQRRNITSSVIKDEIQQIAFQATSQKDVMERLALLEKAVNEWLGPKLKSKCTSEKMPEGIKLPLDEFAWAIQEIMEDEEKGLKKLQEEHGTAVRLDMQLFDPDLIGNPANGIKTDPARTN